MHEPLKNCPFCGGAPTTIERPDNIDGTQFFYAIACYCGRHSACAHKMAVRKTPEIAKADAVAAWNTRTPQPTQAPASAGEPFCYVSVNKQGDITRTMKRKDKWTNIPLYTTPQPTQPQAGAVPLTDEQIRAMCKESWVFETVKQWVRITEQHHGIKGGQHGAE